MPTIIGQSTTTTKRPKSIAETMQEAGDAAFAPPDPLARERIQQSRFQESSRAKALEALQRGDMTEYLAQSVMAHQRAVDAEGYAQLAGVTTPDGLVVQQVNARLAATAAQSSPTTAADPDSAWPRFTPLTRPSPAPPAATSLPDTATGADGGPVVPRFRPAMPASVSPWG